MWLSERLRWMEQEQSCALQGQIRATRRKSRSIELVDELIYKAYDCAWTPLVKHAEGNMLRNWEEKPACQSNGKIWQICSHRFVFSAHLKLNYVKRIFGGWNTGHHFVVSAKVMLK